MIIGIKLFRFTEKEIHHIVITSILQNELQADLMHSLS